MELEDVKDCVVIGVPDLEHDNSEVPMAYIEVNPKCEEDFEVLKKKIEEKCINSLPEYEIPKYIKEIKKIPYHNTKHDFKTLEAMGKEYVNSL